MLEESFVIADLETTGLSPLKNEIIEIGAIRVEKNKNLIAKVNSRFILKLEFSLATKFRQYGILFCTKKI